MAYGRREGNYSWSFLKVPVDFRKIVAAARSVDRNARQATQGRL